MIAYASVLLSLLYVCYAGVPESCAKPLDNSSLDDLYKSSESWKDLRGDRLQENFEHWIGAHPDSGVTCPQFLNVITIFNISAFDLTWQQTLFDTFTPILYCETSEILNIGEFVWSQKISGNTKVYLIADWVTRLIKSAIVDPENLDAFFHTLSTEDPFEIIFHGTVHELRSQVTIRPCVH
eukprot:TRINITY_DN2880_c0_g1_i7.p1 TRINITY_DN2880_c0_g1~~TRINITY_DN2880_c0_g1_i7.p1  ORF type:complete len:181 (-),score=13.88 TRINITY_DN2880_c0_g1_i7:17-559(-)